MNEKRLVKICLIGTLASFFILYILIQQNSVPHVNIGDIDRNFIGKTVNITGYVYDLNLKDENLFFKLNDSTGTIKVVIWKDILKIMENKNTNASKIINGVELEIIGEVQLYKGELEITPLRGQVFIKS
jgi:DNA/RNA endonuclease YhcR with UshA esterase domain